MPMKRKNKAPSVNSWQNQSWFTHNVRRQRARAKAARIARRANRGS